MYDVTVIGPALIDVLASPVDEHVFYTSTQNPESIKLSYGGDALNEACVLAKLGKKVQLISLLGDDDAGRMILHHLEQSHVSVDSIAVRKDVPTGVNLIFVEENGQRQILVSPKSCVRRLDLDDIRPELEKAAPIVSFASIFISTALTIERMEILFREIKESGRILTADVVNPKKGETLEDIRCLMPYLDVFTPNDEEAARLTGQEDPTVSARTFAEAGARISIVKCGGDGAVMAVRGKEDGEISVTKFPAVAGVHCVDTTGAGDTFAGGFLYGLCEGWDWKKCAAFASAAASCAVEAVGATEGLRSQEQVLERMRSVTIL